jgi:hypothetical protein
MITVRMVQPAVYEMVDMVAMRDHLMSAVWTVRMCAVYLRRAGHGICCIERDDMFVDVILVHVVEMAAALDRNPTSPDELAQFAKAGRSLFRIMRYFFARAMPSAISLCASAASPQLSTFTHLPFSRSL